MCFFAFFIGQKHKKEKNLHNTDIDRPINKYAKERNKFTKHNCKFVTHSFKKNDRTVQRYL